MPGFEEIVTGKTTAVEPTYAERLMARWAKQMGSDKGESPNRSRDHGL